MKKTLKVPATLKAKPKLSIPKTIVKAKKQAPKPAAKPVKPAGKAPTKTPPFQNVYHEAFQRFKAGEAVGSLAREFNLKRGKLRREFRKLAGGAPALSKLRALGAGGSVERKPGQPAVPALDDSKVKRITFKETKSWTSRTIRVPAGQSAEDIPVMIDNKTKKEYVIAKSNERADLIYMPKTKSLPPLRIRLLATSSVQRKKDELDAMVMRGTKKLIAKRAAKRAAKQQKKSTKAK